ncbi:MAG: hypothetical protein KAK00_02545 [Nanoarchaeota archaeon]|nr:hypothetical protein [Nanoarchaeota archaeon]
MEQFYEFKPEKKINIKIKEPEIDLSIIKRLGKPKFWVSENDFNKVMEKIYKTASKNARDNYELNQAKNGQPKL